VKKDTAPHNWKAQVLLSRFKLNQRTKSVNTENIVIDPTSAPDEERNRALHDELPGTIDQSP